MIEKIVDDGRKYKVALNLEEDNDVRVIAYNSVKANSKVLDVGCACGDFGELLSHGKGCDVYGMDYNPKSIDVAKSLNVYKQLHAVDLNVSLSDIFESYKNLFDYIILLDVLEHLVNPKESLLRLAPYLKPEGKVIVSLPNISFGDIKLQLLQNRFVYTDTGILDRTHLKFFTWESIVLFFSELGFQIDRCQVKVECFGFKSDKVPFYIKHFIRSNVHSYVYQYILELHPSQLTLDNLIMENRKRMLLNHSDISKRLKRIRRIKLLNNIFPIGSRRRVFIKKLYKRLYRT
jgi:2-polyprenyl-3-methyl-5-hydroxy-6-metoxy-1,4-benzoquinol methylase